MNAQAANQLWAACDAGYECGVVWSGLGLGAAWTVEAAPLVHREQCLRAFERNGLLAERFGSGSQSTPTTGCGLIRCKFRFVIISCRRADGKIFAHYLSLTVVSRFSG